MAKELIQISNTGPRYANSNKEGTIFDFPSLNKQRYL